MAGSSPTGLKSLSQDRRDKAGRHFPDNEKARIHGCWARPHPALEEAASSISLLLRLLRLRTTDWIEVKVVWKLTSTLAE